MNLPPVREAQIEFLMGRYGYDFHTAVMALDTATPVQHAHFIEKMMEKEQPVLTSREARVMAKINAGSTWWEAAREVADEDDRQTDEQEAVVEQMLQEKKSIRELLQVVLDGLDDLELSDLVAVREELSKVILGAAHEG